MQREPSPAGHAERGNILIYILIGIVLAGALTFALSQSDAGKNLDDENLMISANQVQDYAAQMQAGVNLLLQKGVSEADLRFAHPKNIPAYGTVTTTPENQLFHPQGGNVAFKTPPAGVNDGSRWEVIGDLAVPQAGSNRAELTAILPKVTAQFCTAINKRLGITISTNITCSFLPATPFPGSYSTSPYTYADTVFDKAPVLQGCGQCSSGDYYFFYVLATR